VEEEFLLAPLLGIPHFDVVENKMTLLTLITAIALYFSSRKKGYNPMSWILAGGLIGYAILSFLPDTRPVLNREIPNAEEIKNKGNKIGNVLTFFTILAHVILITFFSII